jgi:hypothetical protein
MGGGGSRPAPPPAPTVIEQQPPAGSGESSILYPDRPDTPRLDGITRSLANECRQCDLKISSGISSSSVKITREFGQVSETQCGRYANDLKRVRDKQMSIQSFLGNLQAGRYLRNLKNGFCEQVQLPSEEAQKITKIEEFDEGKLRSIRIQPMSSGGFSSDTKAKLEPSIPFEMSFDGQKIPIKTMTVYHPCPLRLEGTQPDAVMSLNDPSFGNPNYVILVPLVGRNSADPSVEFFDKVLQQIGAVSAPDPTGQYPIRHVPTGDDWTLSKVFRIAASGDGSLDVRNGYYEWKGMPALTRVRRERPGVIEYAWEEDKTTPSPRYILLDTPVAISTTSLATLTQALPPTSAPDAIHAVLYSSNPLQRGIVHKQAEGGVNCKETFTDVQGVTEESADPWSSITKGFESVTEESCDPWTTWAQTSTRGFTTQQIFTLIFNVLIAVAMAVGAYIALIAVLRLYDVEAADLSRGIGKVTAVFFKNLQQKTQALRSLTNPLGAVASLTNMGPAALSKGLGTAALKDALPNPTAALKDIQSTGTSVTKGIENAGTSLLQDVQDTGTSVTKGIENTGTALLKDAPSVPSTKKTRKANINLDYLKGFKPPTARGGR